MSKPLPRFTQTAVVTDPLEIALAQRQAEQERIRQAINDGTHLMRQPLNPRGWPISTRGVSGTSPGTDPLHEAIRKR